MGTGTCDMIKRCRKAGLPEPEFTLTDGFVTTIRRNPELAFQTVAGKKRTRTGQVAGVVARRPESHPESTGQVTGQVTGEVTGEVERVVRVLRGEMKRTAIQKALRLRHEDYFREAYLIPALTGGFIEMTIPDKPTSSQQKYGLTAKGQMLRDRLPKGKRIR
jgi:predicted HTH transcriptional regulator